MVPTGYKTADLLEDSWFEHVASLFWSSSYLPVLPAKAWMPRDIFFCRCCFATHDGVVDDGGAGRWGSRTMVPRTILPCTMGRQMIGVVDDMTM